MTTQAELDAQAEATELKRRVAALEAFVGAVSEAGLDRLVESGLLQFDGIPIRWNSKGMQVIPTSGYPIIWTPEFQTTPQTPTYPAVLQSASLNSTTALWIIRSHMSLSINSALLLNNNTSRADATLQVTWAGNSYDFDVFKDASAAYVAIPASFPLWLSTEAADPTTTLSDGQVWYQSTLDRARLRANGATVSLAHLTDVTDHTGDTSDAHDASAISVLDTGGNFTGTDVEAVLAELAASSGGGMSLIVKASDETVNTSNVLQDDNELLFAVAANTSYQFEGQLFVNASAAGDFQMTFTGPAASVGAFGWQKEFNSSTDFASHDLGTASGLIAGDGAIMQVSFWGAIANGANAGNLTLRWAQQTSNGSDCIVQAGSYLKYQQES